MISEFCCGPKLKQTVDSQHKKDDTNKITKAENEKVIQDKSYERRRKGRKGRSRNWSDDETKLFADVLADDENNFCATLERLALKKNANNVLFKNLKEIFDENQNREEFKELNETTFLNEYGEVICTKNWTHQLLNFGENIRL